jgi:short-subunit dehydrogenase
MQNILITGASSGIGAELAKKFAEPNINLLLIGRNKARLDKVAKECLAKKANVFLQIADVTNSEKIKKIINEFDKKFPLDLVIANAGISAGTGRTGEAQSQVDLIFNVNILGVVNSIYPAIALMKQRKKGHIAIMSSMASFLALPSAPSYSSSKACVRFLGESLYVELKKYNVAVSVICPGYVKSPMTNCNQFPMPFLMSSAKAANIIKTGLLKRKYMIIFPKIMYYFISFLALLPTSLRCYILGKLPNKPSLD